MLAVYYGLFHLMRVRGLGAERVGQNDMKYLTESTEFLERNVRLYNEMVDT